MQTPKEKQELVIKLRLEGATYKQIQDEVGVCKNTIIKILKEQNMLKEPPKELTDDLLQQIQDRYDECHNIKIVAKEFKVSYSRLKGKIKMKEAKNTPKKSLKSLIIKELRKNSLIIKGVSARYVDITNVHQHQNFIIQILHRKILLSLVVLNLLKI